MKRAEKVSSSFCRYRKRSGYNNGNKRLTVNAESLVLARRINKNEKKKNPSAHMKQRAAIASDGKMCEPYFLKQGKREN